MNGGPSIFALASGGGGAERKRACFPPRIADDEILRREMADLRPRVALWGCAPPL